MKTKMILLTSALCVVVMSSLSAQFKDQVSIGPRAGINFSNVSNVEGSKSKKGLVLGLTSTYSLNESSGLTLDVLYSVEGYRIPFEEHEHRYLQIPFYFDLFFGKLGDRFRPKVYVGAVPGFYLSGTVNDFDANKNYFNKFQLAASGGLGFNYRVGSRIWLNTDLRSYIGLSDIRSKNFNQGDPINPRTVQLSLGLAYGLAKL